MRALRLVAAVTTLVLALPAAAQAGTVTRDGNAINRPSTVADNGVFGELFNDLDYGFGSYGALGGGVYVAGGTVSIDHSTIAVTTPITASGPTVRGWGAESSMPPVWMRFGSTIQSSRTTPPGITPGLTSSCITPTSPGLSPRSATT